jgi:hypothetical protein
MSLSSDISLSISILGIALASLLYGYSFGIWRHRDKKKRK